MKRLGIWSTAAVALCAFLLISTACYALWGFGHDWTFNKCPNCKKFYKHPGVDFQARAGQTVYFNKNGTVRQSYADGQWAHCVVIDTGGQTFVIWHIDRAVKTGGIKAGTAIGKVANLGGNTHIHLGQRNAAFDSKLSSKGALPACNHRPQGLPQFPERFVPPASVISIK